MAEKKKRGGGRKAIAWQGLAHGADAPWRQGEQVLSWKGHDLVRGTDEVGPTEVGIGKGMENPAGFG